MKDNLIFAKDLMYGFVGKNIVVITGITLGLITNIIIL